MKRCAPTSHMAVRVKNKKPVTRLGISVPWMADDGIYKRPICRHKDGANKTRVQDVSLLADKTVKNKLLALLF